MDVVSGGVDVGRGGEEVRSGLGVRLVGDGLGGTGVSGSEVGGWWTSATIQVVVESEEGIDEEREEVVRLWLVNWAI